MTSACAAYPAGHIAALKGGGCLLCGADVGLLSVPDPLLQTSLEDEVAALRSRILDFRAQAEHQTRRADAAEQAAASLEADLQARTAACARLQQALTAQTEVSLAACAPCAGFSPQAPPPACCWHTQACASMLHTFLSHLWQQQAISAGVPRPRSPSPP